MLEIQNFVSNELDKKNTVGMYSLDLTAVFDLLRPDILKEHLTDVNPKDPLDVILDFLNNKKFKVKIGLSDSRSLNVGCVQGSVLGPLLFTLYLSKLGTVLPPAAFITSYADDTYICLSNKSLSDLSSSLEATMTLHDDFLNSIGMVTNVEKTELIYFSRKTQDGAPLKVKNKLIQPSKKIKVLGVTFEQDLTWKSHIRGVTNRVRYTMRKPKFLRKILNKEDMLKVVTAHVWYYLLCCPRMA